MKIRGFSINFGIDKDWRPRFSFIKVPLRRIRPKFKTASGTLETVKRFGIRLDFMIGTMKRPIPKIFLKEFWMRNAKSPGDENYIQKESTINPWNSNNHWFVLNIPVCPGVFVSAFIQTKEGKQPGLYIGTKTYEVNRISSQLLDYASQKYQTDENGNPIYTWASVEEQGRVYMCLSASLRSDLIEDK